MLGCGKMSLTCPRSGFFDHLPGQDCLPYSVPCSILCGGRRLDAETMIEQQEHNHPALRGPAAPGESVRPPARAIRANVRYYFVSTSSGILGAGDLRPALQRRLRLVALIITAGLAA